MIVLASRQFEKKTAKLKREMKVVLARKLELFMDDPYNEILNNHALHGSMRHYRSVNITGDYRLIYEQYEKDVVRLIDIDTHHNIYGT